MTRRVFARAFFVAALALPLVLAAVSPAGARQITTNSTPDDGPRVSNDRIVWQGTGGTDGGTDYEIFTWTPAGGVKQLTANNVVDEFPRVSGDRIVWDGAGGTDGGTDLEVFTWTPAGGVKQLTADLVNEFFPRVSNDRITWFATGGSDGGTDNEVFTWTPAGGIQQLTVNTKEDVEPDVSGDRVAWMGTGGSDGGTDFEVFTWTPAGVNQQVTVNTVPDEAPQVSGDRIAWFATGGSDGGTDFEIFTWTPAGIVQITANTATDIDAEPSGDRVVWMGTGGSDGGTDFEVFTWTPAGMQQITANTGQDQVPQVSGDRIGWFAPGGSDGGTDFEIFGWTPATGLQQLTANATNDFSTDVSKDRTAWAGVGGTDGGTDTEVFSVVASNVVSVEGPTRIQTAIAASKAAFDRADTVVIATGFNFPDALGGSSLAGALDAPLLLTATDALPSDVADEIKRLGAKDAVILGGTPAVGPGVATQLATLLGGSMHVRRIGGADRYETAAMVAAETVHTITAKGGTYDGTVFVAVGTNFPDALAASPLAAAKGWPILLTRTAGLPGASLSALDTIAAKRGIMLGSVSVVSTIVEGQLQGKLGPTNVSRLEGPNRYLTAIAVANFGIVNGVGFTNPAIATGENYPDALSGGVMAGRFDSVLLLTPKDSLFPGVGTLLTANKASVERVHFLGSTAALSQAVRDQVTTLLK